MGKKSLMQRVISAIVVALAISLPGFTHAQEEHRIPEAGNGDGMDTHLFRPAVDSKGFFSVNGSDILGGQDISFGLVMDYGHNLMRLEPGHGADALITHSFQGTFNFNYGIASVASVGFTLPVNLVGGDAANNIGPAGAPYNAGQLNSQSFGFFALHAKYRLTRVERGFGLALLGQVGFSSADKDLASDGMFFWPQLIAEKRFSSTGV